MKFSELPSQVVRALVYASADFDMTFAEKEAATAIVMERTVPGDVPGVNRLIDEVNQSIRRARW